MLSAAPRTRSCATPSPLTIRRSRAPAPAFGTGALEFVAEITAPFTRSLHGRDRLQFLRDDRLGQLREEQRLGHSLTVGEHPLEKVRNGFLLCRILNLRRDQQPGEAGNRVCRLA